MTTIEDLQKICDQLPGVTQDIKWEDHLCFNIGGKMFLVTSPDHFPISASFKVDDEDFEEISTKPGFIPAPYMARNKWVRLDDITKLGLKQWEAYINRSYYLIASKLTKKLQKELGIS